MKASSQRRPSAERNAQVELSLMMLAQHRDGGRGQGDEPAPVQSLGRFDPDARLRLFDRALDAELAGVEVEVAPLQSHKLAASGASR
jgi:hypothetical protein